MHPVIIHPPKVSCSFFVLVGILDFKPTNVVEVSLLRWENGHPLNLLMGCSPPFAVFSSESAVGNPYATRQEPFWDEKKTPATKHLDNILL